MAAGLGLRTYTRFGFLTPLSSSSAICSLLLRTRLTTLGSALGLALDRGGLAAVTAPVLALTGLVPCDVSPSPMSSSSGLGGATELVKKEKASANNESQWNAVNSLGYAAYLRRRQLATTTPP